MLFEKVSSMKKQCEHQGDCMQLIQRILDKEATPEEEALFVNKKEQCLPCKEGYELEQSLKKAIKEKCASKCPDDLFQSIKAKLFILLAIISILIPLFCDQNK